MRPFGFAAVILATIVSGCARPAGDGGASIRAAIVAADRDFMAAFSADDAQAIGLLYAEDASLLPPNAEPVPGRAAITKYWETLLLLPVKDLHVETDEVYGEGDMVTEEGRYTLVNDQNVPIDEGKYLVVWKKTPQGWRVYRDMWSSDAPSTSTPADTTAAAPARP